MEDYPRNYVTITRPLVVLLGLQDEQANTSLPKPLNNGATVSSDLATLPEYRMIAIAKALSKYDASHVDNDARGDVSNQLVSQSMIFHFKQSNRRYAFPSRKASPAPSRVSTIIGRNGASTLSPPLHSPLSPLSPGSPTFPDGVMTPLWFMKYQEAIPAVFVSFFEITHDENSDTLNDNRLKSEIIAFHSRLNDLNYKGKHIVVLFGEESVEMDTNIDTRLVNIRKGAKLENKTTYFYLPPNVSMTDLDFFAEALAQSLRPLCTEFYKNLHKHTRRKKDRRSSSSSPSTPIVDDTAQHLLPSSWTTRYALKMGLFSEVRFEMDAASRSYGEALDHLLNLQGTFDQTSSWSPRFNEARLLADSIAVRRLRCLLADGHTAEAANFWSTYRYRTKDMVERRGKGSETYGWPCWKARWAKAMAQLVQGNTHFASDINAKRNLEPLLPRRALAYAVADRRNRMQDQSNPWSSELHHSSYWYMLSARYQAVRAEKAHEIPDEDKVPPSRSPASSVSRVHREYESYLCPEPNVEGNEVNHAEIIVDLLSEARAEFSKRSHGDCSSVVGLAIAEQLASYLPDQALTVLRKLHDDRSLRKREWTTMLEAVSIKLYEVANLTKDRDSQIRALWQLLNKDFDLKTNISYDLSSLIATADHEARGQGNSIDIDIEAGSGISFLDTGICFEAGDVSAGERARLQVILSSAAQHNTSPVKFSSLIVRFHDFPSIILSDNGDASPSRQSQIFQTAVQESRGHDSPFTALANLSMYPDQTRVFDMSIPTRDIGELRARDVSLRIQKPNITVSYTRALTNSEGAFRWYSIRPGTGLVKQRQRRDGALVKVLPKQPKMMLHVPSLRPTYFGGERAIIDIEMINEESDDVEVELETWLEGIDAQPEALSFRDDPSTLKSSTRPGGVGGIIGTMKVNAKIMISLVIKIPSAVDGDMTLELEVRYHSLLDAHHQTTKRTSTKLNIAEPFAANFTVEPILHPDPWPTYFDIDASGLHLRWRLQLHLKSLPPEEIILTGGEMQLSSISEGATCNRLQQPVTKAANLATSETFDLDFVMDIQKESLDDANPATVDANMLVSWRRHDSNADDIIRTIITAPRLDLPTSEPRALATRQKTTDDGGIPLTITLENPSMHYLSFEITLEPTDDFVLSGSTNKSLNLVPLSRSAIDFTILPMVSNASLRPLVKVRDTYFDKLLHIHPGDGMSADDAGHLVIWIDPAR